MEPSSLAALPFHLATFAVSPPPVIGIRQHRGLKARSTQQQIVFEVSYTLFSYMELGLAVVYMLISCSEAHVVKILVWRLEKNTVLPQTVAAGEAAAS